MALKDYAENIDCKGLASSVAGLYYTKMKNICYIFMQ